MAWPVSTLGLRGMAVALMCCTEELGCPFHFKGASKKSCPKESWSGRIQRVSVRRRLAHVGVNRKIVFFQVTLERLVEFKYKPARCSQAGEAAGLRGASAECATLGLFCRAHVRDGERGGLCTAHTHILQT